MRVVDSSLLYAALDGRDPRHEDARRLMEESEPVLLPLAVLAEFLDLVAYRYGRSVAAQADETLQGLPHLVIRHAGDPEAALRLWRGNPAVSLVDCVGIQACLETGADLMSYDRDQLAALPKR